MAQNYNLNSSFGFNVTARPKQQTKQQEAPQKINLETTIGNLFDSITSFSPEAEKVYNGDVEKQINMYSRQAMIVGMNLRNAEEHRNFDMNI